MAFNAAVQVLTQPGSTGNQTYSLASNFDPKAVILWATPQTADGSAANCAYGVGFGTYRGAVVQERYSSMRALDAAANADTAAGSGSDALLMLMTQSAGAGTRDLEIDLVSMQTGATSQVVLNWVNLHTTASIRVFMLVLGGSDITDALADTHTMATGTTTHDETVVSGFGKPDLLFFSCGKVAAGDAAGDANFLFGFGKQGEAGRGFGYFQVDNSAASDTTVDQRSDQCVASDFGIGGGISHLDTTVANWPTDGFRLVALGTQISVFDVHYLALRTTAQITTGANLAPNSGGLPVNQDNAAGFPPKLGFLFGWNLAASAATQTTAADQVGFGIGAYDGTQEAWAGFTEDDAAVTMDSNNQQSTAKVIRNYDAAAVLQSEADGVFSGNNFRVSWNDIDSVQRQYQWLAIGDGVAAAAVIPFIHMARS